MKKVLINYSQNEEVRIAFVDKNWLYDLYIENFNNKQNKSNIYKGKITRIEPSLEAIFVDYGYDKHGFLPIKDISNDYLSEEYFKLDNKNLIKNFLKEGQDILVQVSKEERLNKGAVLTTFICLSGTYLVLVPNNPKSYGISKRIEGEKRKIMKNILNKLNIPKNFGVIIRTSGVNKSMDDLQNDLNLRIKHWESIKDIYKNNSSPSLIYKENDLITRIFRDYLTSDILEIIIDNKNFIEESKNRIIELGINEILNKIKFYSNEIPLFSYYKIEHQIESAFKRNVKLPSGGSITIDTTEALTSIDINSSKSNKCLDIEETAIHTNLEASKEIARQIRLRDLGGLIVIDFIDMNNKKNISEVENKLKESTYQDKAKIKFGKISKFGLFEMSRQRLTTSLKELNYYACPRCSGNGFIRNNKSLSLSILRLIEEESIKESIKEIHVIVPILIGTYLLNEKRSVINKIEKRKHNSIRIIIVPYDQIKTPNYLIIRVKHNEPPSTILSYLLPQIHEKNIKNNNFKTNYINKLNNNNKYINKSINNRNNIYLQIFKDFLIIFYKIKLEIFKYFMFILNNIYNILLKIKNIFINKFYIKNNRKKYKYNYKYNFNKNRNIKKKWRSRDSNSRIS